MRTAAAILLLAAAAPARTVTLPVQGQPAREVAVTAGPAAPVAALAFHPAGKLLASAGYREVLLWDLAGARLDRRLGTGRIAGNIRALQFSPDGRTLAVADGEPGVAGEVRLIDLESGELSGTFEPLKDEITAVAFHPKEPLLAAGGPDGAVRIWNLKEKQLAATLKQHAGAVATVAFSPDGKWMASGGADRVLQVWDASDWKPLVRLPQNATEAVTAAAFSPEGDTLAFVTAGEDERAVRVWRTEFAPEPKEGDPNAPRLRAGRRTARPLDLWSCSPLGLAWARGRIYVACTDRTVRVLNNNGSYAATLVGHQDWVYAVAASADGQRIASGSGDGTVKIWNRADGALLATALQLAPRSDRWMIVTPRGYFTASAAEALEWRGVAKPAAAELSGRLLNPEAVRNILAGRPPVAPAPKGSSR